MIKSLVSHGYTYGNSEQLHSDFPVKTFVVPKDSTTFKFAVFTDLHFGEDASTSTYVHSIRKTAARIRGTKDYKSTRVMENVLNADFDIDFVVFNGDQVSGEYIMADHANSIIDDVLYPVVKRNIPFASTYGNHDESVNITHLSYYKHESSAYSQLSYTQANSKSSHDPNGQFNYVIPVLRENHHNPDLLLWFFDSRSCQYPQSQESHVRYPNLPDWVDPHAALWANMTSKALLSYYKLDKLPSSVVFMHIPMNNAVRIQEEFQSHNQPIGIDEDHHPLWQQGSYHQGIWEPDRAIWDTIVHTLAKHSHVITIHGHDHGENWCAPAAHSEPANAIRITTCFARRSGYGGYGNWPRGSQIFEIALGTDSHKKSSTYLRLENQTIVNATELPI